LCPNPTLIRGAYIRPYRESVKSPLTSPQQLRRSHISTVLQRDPLRTTYWRMFSPTCTTLATATTCNVKRFAIDGSLLPKLRSGRCLQHQLWTSWLVEGMSALPPKADIGQRNCDVRFVPKSGHMRCTKNVAIRSPRRRLEVDKTALGDVRFVPKADIPRCLFLLHHRLIPIN